MRRSLLNIGVLAAAAVMLAPAVAHADGTDLSLRVEGAVAAPLTQPQDARFGWGGAAALKPTLALLPALDANVTFSGLGLSSKVAGVDTGTAIGIGGGLRLKRPHDASNTGSGLSAASPWVDTDLQFVRTGYLNRAGLSVGAGVSFPLTEDRVVWLGPYARYLDVVEPVIAGTNSTDAHVFMVGLELEIGGAVAQAAAAPPPAPAPRPDVTTVTVTKDPPPAPKQDPVAVHITINERIPFPFDSATPLPEAQPALAAALQVLLAHTDLKVQVEGHASNEGRPQAEKHNQALSEARAQAVMAWLIQNGVPADKLTVRGFGTRKPLAGVAPADPSQRRVEFDVDFTLTSAGAQ